MAKKASAEYLERRAAEAEFDRNRPQLAEECRSARASGKHWRAIAEDLNARGLRTKTGAQWSAASVLILTQKPDPTYKPTRAERTAHAAARKGLGKNHDRNLSWVKRKYPHLDDWRLLASEWLHGREEGLGHAFGGVNALMAFIGDNSLPTDPAVFLMRKTQLPNFYESRWGKTRTHGTILTNNAAHAFLKWVLTRPAFCEEDDEGQLRTSPAFGNPIPYRNRRGLPHHVESVRGALPYAYIDELRRMIAAGPHFRDWKFAQEAVGGPLNKHASDEDETAEDSDDDATLGPQARGRVSTIWYQVDPSLIDKDDPDCVWRARRRLVPNEPGREGMGRDFETVYEMWSPVRWVALLLKLQLPLRTFQVRMLDSGEADTWRWSDGEWRRNDHALAKGTEERPYANGMFLRPTQSTDGDAKVLLHINTNKTADIGRAGNQKGYNVPWVVGGPIHQDPFYWLEKLRRWQEKYNPLHQLTKWTALDGRHIPPKSAVQLTLYPDTAFLFRMPEVKENPSFPPTITILNRPWAVCLAHLEDALAARGETLHGGGRVRFIPEHLRHLKSNATTFFPLHSLRVSLITALALDGEVPLSILQKVAGHSRLVMTLYYTKPGAARVQQAIQAGVVKLNESAGDTLVDWLATSEYTELVRDVIANNIDSFKAAVPEQAALRSPAGWMVMVDGLCLVGGNVSEEDAAGCHNGGPNIGNDSAPRYAPVPGGARNCPRCRWFVTRPYFLPQLAARWNNAMAHCDEAKERVVLAEQRYFDLEDQRAAAISGGEVFAEQVAFKEAERVREQAIRKFDEAAMTVAAVTKLMERCRRALHTGDGTALIAGGSTSDFEFAIEEVDSELLQLSGVCQATELYPDLDPGKAVLRQSQLLDAALSRDKHAPVFLMLSEQEQLLVGNAFLRQLAQQMNPENPGLGRYRVISLIDAGQSLREHFGPAIEDHLRVAIGAAPTKAQSARLPAVPALLEAP